MIRVETTVVLFEDVGLGASTLELGLELAVRDVGIGDFAVSLLKGGLVLIQFALKLLELGLEPVILRVGLVEVGVGLLEIIAQLCLVVELTIPVVVVVN